ncbi:signal peptidase II [Patescibacteria group bacterium]
MIKARNAFVACVSLMAVDQFVKYTIRHKGGFYICNDGIAFGWDAPDVLLLAFWVIFLGLSIFYFAGLLDHERVRNFSVYKVVGIEVFSGYGFALIVAGAFSNLIDRGVFGCVIDFIDLRIWPVFNFADIFIFLGALMIVRRILREK